MNGPTPTDSRIVLVLGSRNAKKAREMAALIAPPWEPNPRLERLSIRSAGEFPDAPDVVEDADTFAGNARKKAAEVARALGVWVLADDSGLAVDALDGAPGVLSARYAGEPCDDEANNRKLLDALAVAGRRSTRRGVPMCAGPGRSLGDDPARGRRLLSRADHPRGPGTRRVRLRPALPDPGVSPDVRRAQPAGQAPAQPPRPGVRPPAARDRPADRHGRDRGLAASRGHREQETPPGSCDPGAFPGQGARDVFVASEPAASRRAQWIVACPEATTPCGDGATTGSQ